jgi:RHS repeat-associated protein
MSEGTDATAESSVLSLPKGGGAVGGMGEKFAADLFSGTGSFTVPIAVPAGRSGLTPQLSLAYSSGGGNGPFGLGWQLSLPGVVRKTSRGIPQYADVAGAARGRADVFVLAGAEDLVPVPGGGPFRVRYQPRTEGLFARIEHVRDNSGNYWEVRGKDGVLTRYGTPRPAGADANWRDPALVADPADTSRVFGWRITETRDQVGNVIRYGYLRDVGAGDGHRWDQPLINRISYADYGDRGAPSFLVEVEFQYEARPDPFSDHRAGFELRTSLRCRTIRVTTHAADGVARTAREYVLSYQPAAFNVVSLLTRLDVVGVDDQGVPAGQQPARELLPPLTFGYSGFDPAGRRFAPVTGPALPAVALSDPTVALVDLRGAGLPDVIELGATQRVWYNAGAGRFERPRQLAEAPPVSLRDPGVRFLDADGDGRPDLLVSAPASGRGTAGAAAGYYPMAFGGGWSRRSFRPYRQAPSMSLADPAVKLIDLDGDGLTDVLRSGTRLECWFNDPDPRVAWQRSTQASLTGPAVDLADPRVRLADMTGDGLHDIVLLNNGNIVYWPNLGLGRWGAPVTMRRSPRLPDGFNPSHVLLGDLDGDGAADLAYVDSGRVLVWGNQTGNAWSEQPVTITGTPMVVDTDSVQLSDLHGTGMAGLLFSRAADGSGRTAPRFLDLAGGVKPYLLEVMDNHLGATTRVSYTSSTQEFLRDQATRTARWRTTLPFPVHVVNRVEVTDAISGGRQTTRYQYHHGYWDGVEREFRGFAMVEHFDTETFAPSADGTHYSPPTLTRSWFHPGPVAAAEGGDWVELDLRDEYWAFDAPTLSRPAAQEAFLAGLPRTARRAALRALRGQQLRTELYALDGTDREQRPYTVTEAVHGVREESATDTPDDVRERVFFPFPVAERTTQWERGDEPMTRFTFHAGYDAYGFATGQVEIAVPRGRDPRVGLDAATEPYLATFSTTEYARRDDADRYLVDRVCRTTMYEVVNDGRARAVDLRDQVVAGPAGGAAVSLRVIGHARTYYDGDAFTGSPLGQLGAYGLPVRTETLTVTGDFLRTLYPADDPAAHTPPPPYLDPAADPASLAGYPREFLDRLAPLVGYVFYGEHAVPGSPGGYYVLTARHRYDVHEAGRVPRGLVVASLDPFGAQSQVEYDSHDLLPVRITDPAGLVTVAVNDYRVLHPSALTDVNGNTTSVTFSPAGLVTAQYVRGKDGDGDRDAPSTRMSYDLLAYADRGQPASVRTTRRVHHDTATGGPADQIDDVIVSVEFSDGFGRLVQTRTQAEDTLFGDATFGGGLLPADQLAPVGDAVGRTRGPADPDNVIVSGWQVYDNKGRVVLTYEPFFAAGYAYTQPADHQLGQRTTTFYDPRGQVVRVVAPDGSEQRVVFGIPMDVSDPDKYAPTPWESYRYDANDNAGRTHPATAAGYAEHWNTPSSTEVDALGRTVRAVTRNGDPNHADTEWFTTQTAYDIQGNLIAITDALGRAAHRYAVDLAKRRWRADSVDAGRQDTVRDAVGGVVERRDSKGALALAAFDRLHRPSRLWARDGGAGAITLRRRTDYGDAGDPGQPAAERAAARAANLLGRPVRQYDEAGLVTTDAIDFKGNVRESTRRVIADGPVLDSYAGAAAGSWQITPFRVDWTPAPGQAQDERDRSLLEAHAYATSTGYDALNRITSHQLPAGVTGQRQEFRLSYNRAGALDALRLDGTVYVQRIAYDATGRRVLIAHGNGVLTRYAYDPRTFHLIRLRSEPYRLDPDGTYRPQGTVLQDYGYDHDLAGNVLAVHDRTPGSGIRNNPEALAITDPVLRKLIGDGDALDRRFSYDPIYRLLSATGREQGAPPPGDPWLDTPRGTDVTLAQAYTERYHYDPVGGVLSIDHADAGTSGFSRGFTVESASNRLRRMTVGGTPYDYRYDASGNMLGEATTRHFTWNHADQLVAFATQTPGAEPSVHAQYLYGASGERVKKLVRRQGGAVEVTHYLDGAFEHHRWSGPSGGQQGENNHVHVMDDRERVALVRTGPAHPDDRGPAVAVHLADHLGSSTVVVDGAGALVNREEYTPNGETSFGSYARKRYRFTGRERDEESGLRYHRARYCAGHLARWISADPAGAVDGPNLYRYVRDNPLVLVDPAGTDPVKTMRMTREEMEKAGLSTKDFVDDAKLSMPSQWFESGTVYDPATGKTDRAQLSAIRGAPEYVDNAVVSVGTRIKNVLTLEITHFNFAFRNKPDLLIDRRSIDLGVTARSDNFIKIHHVIYPVGADGRITYNRQDTPNIVANALMKSDLRVELLNERQKFAELANAFAGILLMLGHFAANSNARIPPGSGRRALIERIMRDRMDRALRAGNEAELGREMDRIIRETDITPKHPPLVDPSKIGKP